MSTDAAVVAMSGAILLGFLLIGAFFWRFWTTTRESIFVFFAVAFCLMAFERLLLLLEGIEATDRPLIYLTRLIAFLVIIVGIWRANGRKPG